MRSSLSQSRESIERQYTQVVTTSQPLRSFFQASTFPRLLVSVAVPSLRPREKGFELDRRVITCDIETGSLIQSLMIASVEGSWSIHGIVSALHIEIFGDTFRTTNLSKWCLAGLPCTVLEPKTAIVKSLDCASSIASKLVAVRDDSYYQSTRAFQKDGPTLTGSVAHVKEPDLKTPKFLEVWAQRIQRIETPFVDMKSCPSHHTPKHALPHCPHYTERQSHLGIGALIMLSRADCWTYPSSTMSRFISTMLNSGF